MIAMVIDWRSDVRKTRASFVNTKNDYKQRFTSSKI